MIQSKRFQRLSWAVSGVVTLLMLSNAESAPFENLYTITVPRGFGDELRSDEEYVPLAMGQLLARVTGRTGAFLEPNLQNLISNANDYVIEKGWPNLEGYRVTFDDRAILTSLSQRNEPIWVEERPLTLLWIAVDTVFDERGVLAADPQNQSHSEDYLAIADEIKTQLEGVAYARGLPIKFPLWDLQDMESLGFFDVWEGISHRLEQSSERYEIDAILNGRVWMTSRGLDVQWTLMRGPDRFILPGGSLQSGLDKLADLYAGEFSSSGSPTASKITVMGLKNIEDYAHVMRYIENLQERHILESVDIEEFAETTLSLSMMARGGPELLERVLGLSGVLTPAASISDNYLETQLSFFYLDSH